MGRGPLERDPRGRGVAGTATEGSGVAAGGAGTDGPCQTGLGATLRNFHAKENDDARCVVAWSRWNCETGAYLGKGTRPLDACGQCLAEDSGDEKTAIDWDMGYRNLWP